MNIKKLFIKIFKSTINKHKVEIQIKEGRLLFSVKNLGLFPSHKYIILKDRETGRFLNSQIKNRTAIFNLKDIADFGKNGIFDVYISLRLHSKYLRKRTPFSLNDQGFVSYSEDLNLKFKSFKTKNGYLSFDFKKNNFSQYINILKSVGSNFYIEGEVTQFSNEYQVNQLELIAVRRDNNKSFGYSINFTQQGNKYIFKQIIMIDKLKKDLDLNSRWDLFLQIRDNNRRICYKELIDMTGFTDFSKEEDRYLLANDYKDKYKLIVYVTMGKESLAFWFTDNEQYLKTYNIARGKTVFNNVCESQPMNKTMVFFESFLGKSYSGNPKYIYEYLIENGYDKEYQFIWSYQGESKIPGNPIIVNREEEDYYRYLALSKYWVNNIIFPVHRKREGNVYIQTWHGTPLKRLGYDIEVDGPEKMARENFYLESRNWDYLLAANEYSKDIFQRAFKFEKEIILNGYPSNDIFHKNNKQERIESIKTKLNIPKNKQVILYAPTWRDNELSGSWNHSFEMKFDLEQFQREFGDDYILILRMHHLISDYLVLSPSKHSSIIDLSKYDDIQELYLISDILITDYSSVFFEYANSKKPILFYAYDYQLYKEEIRGFYLDMYKDLPGPVLEEQQQLFAAIRNIHHIKDEYSEKYNEFYQKYCGLEKGDSAKLVSGTVFGNQ
ncbi:CDP-glycerol glycerophosphotransferase family protein [Bacillus safensis]|uniref:CDP-glycerol glycerophosphotransferase family protein n=1 Tax=Bacillus safensis TaxID=561879 RepID=UPI00344CE8BB